ncbi:MAG: PocR ligand-binding domain-containing protein [Spirochaetes bacterium]|nr:PocR ligand-binding domain-containing protein [Spirochaetota bacterium]
MHDSGEYSDLFNVNLLQKISDDFAAIADVGSVIYDLSGNPITEPSNFCGYCKLIRGTEKGRRACIKSDAELWELAKGKEGGAILCKSGRLMDGIAPIIVEGRRIANWGIGQVLFGEPDEEWVRRYARDIGIDEDLLLSEYRKVKRVPEENFLKTIKYLITLSGEISEIALANKRLKSEIRSRIKSEERYRAIVKNAVVGVCEITNRGVLEYVNDQMCVMLGYDNNELTGTNISNIMKSERDFRSYFKGIVDYANQSYANIGYDFKGSLRKKDGEMLPCRICLTPQKNLSNQVVKSSAVIIDVSAEEKALEALELRNRELVESKKQMDMFFDNNLNALCIYDASLRRLKYNPAYVKLVEDIGETETLSNNGIWEPIEEAQLHRLFSGEITDIEVKREYGIKLYSIKATPILDYDNSISRVLITVKDITDYQLMMENALFSEKMSGVGMLASGIAHDMKGIFAILGNSNCTLKRMVSTSSNDEFNGNLKRVLTVQEDGLKNGRRLLSQLISLAGNSPEHREQFNLKECIENVVRIYNSMVLDKNANISVDIREGILITGFRSRFIQIIMNLFSNALEAIRSNGEIKIFEKSETGKMKLIITDNGDGIGDDEKVKIFQAFYTTKEHGTGLGLFTVKNIVDGLGGNLRVESMVGVGSRFTIEINDNEQVSTILN